MRLTTDVCVVGGGPSGSACAAQLARLGHDVLLVERERFPRPRIGEAVSAGILRHLDLLGVRDRVANPRVAIRTDAFVRWLDGSPEPSVPPAHLVVDRGRFDEILLGAARDAGVRVFQPARVLRPRVLGDGRVRVVANDGDLAIEAKYVAYATGRRGWLPGSRRIAGAPTIALYALWSMTCAAAPNTWVQAGPDAWYWAAALPNGTYNIVAFVDGLDLRSHVTGDRSALTHRYQALIEESGLLARLGEPNIVGGVAACDATVRVDNDPIGDGFIKLGDCSLALDPLSASGVERAIQTGLTGSRVIHTVLSRPERESWARKFYKSEQQASVVRHTTWTQECYARHRSFAEREFWRRRAGASVQRGVSSDNSIDILDALDCRVCLSTEAALVESPCLIDDLVDCRSALIHPNLDGPVAFLQGVALAPFIASTRVSTVKDLIHHWSSLAPFETRLRVLSWLWEKRVLVPLADLPPHHFSGRASKQQPLVGRLAEEGEVRERQVVLTDVELDDS